MGRGGGHMNKVVIETRLTTTVMRKMAEAMVETSCWNLSIVRLSIAWGALTTTMIEPAGWAKRAVRGHRLKRRGALER